MLFRSNSRLAPSIDGVQRVNLETHAATQAHGQYVDEAYDGQTKAKQPHLDQDRAA